MANDLTIKHISVTQGGNTANYDLSIYAQLGITEDALVELLSRDFFVPTLASAPGANTLTYSDGLSDNNPFRVGQYCRVADTTTGKGYAFYMLFAINNGTAVWGKVTFGVASSSADGLMSSADKAKLDGITASADSVAWTGSVASSANGAYKIGTITINGTAVDVYGINIDTDTHKTLAELGGVPTTRKVNGKALSADIALTDADTTIDIPTLSAAPTAATKTYTYNSGTYQFRIGQMCRVADAESETGYTLYTLHDILDGNAVWQENGIAGYDSLGQQIDSTYIKDIEFGEGEVTITKGNGSSQSFPFEGGGGSVQERAYISLSSNLGVSDASLVGAQVTVRDTTQDVEVFNGTWQGEAIVAKITPLSSYTVTVGGVAGYATPQAQTFTAAISFQRNITFVYNTCVLTATLDSNQTDKSDIASAKAVVSYSGRTIQLSSGQSCKVPHGVEIQVSATDVTDYTAPTVQTFTTTSAAKDLTLTYKTCLMTVVIDGFENNESAQATIAYGSNSKTVDSGAATKIPFGVQATVTCPAVNGYGTPAAQTITTDAAAKSVTMTYVPSALKVTIGSNQTDKSDIAGLKATVSWTGHSEQVSSGTTIAIPLDKQVTISFPALAGYRKPSDIILTNSSGGLAERTGKYETEVVTVTVNADNSASMNGQTITVNGANYTYNGAFSVKIPFGTSYSVSANAKDGYLPPATQNFTAGQASRSVTLTYTYKPIGAFIELTDGRLITASQWTSGMTANSVVFSDGNHGFRMALNDVSGTHKWGQSGTSVPVVTKSNYTAAGTDYEGKANTDVLMNYSDTAAAHAARGYTFPNGQQGYLPGGGEFMLYVNNKEAINACLTAAGGAALNLSNTYYWTSTQYSASSAWYWSCSAQRLYDFNKYFTCTVRPFSAF